MPCLLLAALVAFGQVQTTEARIAAASEWQRSNTPANWEKARVEFQALYEAMDASTEPRARCAILLGQGRAANQTRKPADGIRYLVDAEAACANDAPSRARAASALGVSHLLLNHPTDAEPALLRARQIWQGVADADVAETTRVENNLAHAYWLLGRLDQSEDAYRSVAALKQRGTDRFGYMLARTGVGNALLYQGDASGAREEYEAALAIARELKSARDEAQALNSVGYAQFQLGRLRDAMARYNEALPIWRRVAAQDGETMTLANIAWLRLSQHDWQAALDVYQKALELARKGDASRNLAYILHGIGNARLGLNQYGPAREAYEESLALKRGVKDRYGEAATLAQLAELRLRQGEAGTALQLAQESLELRRQMLDAPGEAATLALLARIEGKTDAALEHMRAAIAIVERQRGAITTAETRAAFFSTAQDYYRQWIEMLPGRAAETWAIEERRLARALLDELDQNRRMAPSRELNTLNKRLEALSRRLQNLPPASPEFQAVRKQMLAALSERDSMQTRLLPLTAGTEPLEPRAIQERLPVGTAMVHFSLGEKQARAWVVTRSNIRLVALGPASAIRAAGADYQKLSRLLLAPALPNARQLILVAPDELRGIPFAALPHPVTGKALIETHELSTVPSASVWAALQGKPRFAPGGKGFVVADPDYGVSHPIYAPLPFTREEWNYLTKLAPDRVESLTGATATADSLRGRKLGGYSWLHFAGHAEADTERGELGALILAGPSALRAYEISQWQLEAPVVVLNACETGLGEQVAGEGSLSLARAFLSAGARGVAATLWRIPDASAAELMRRFYDNLLVKRLAPAAALRQAQLALLHDPRFAEPRHWAAFQWIGPHQ